MNKDQITFYCKLISLIGDLLGNIEDYKIVSQLTYNRHVFKIVSNIIELLKDKNKDVCVATIHIIADIFNSNRDIDDKLVFELILQLTILLKNKHIYQPHEYFAIVKAIQQVIFRSIINKNLIFEDEIRLPLLNILIKELPNLTTAVDEIIFHMVLNVIMYLTFDYVTEDNSVNYISDCIKKSLDREIEYHMKDLITDILNMGKS